jgi:hypothetical protein
MDNFTTSLVIRNLLIQMPVVTLVWLVGLILAVVRWRQHPGVSLIAIFAIALYFMISVVSPFYPMLFELLVRSGRTTDQADHIFMMVDILLSLLKAGTWILILAAIFGWRRGKEKSA